MALDIDQTKIVTSDNTANDNIDPANDNYQLYDKLNTLSNSDKDKDPIAANDLEAYDYNDVTDTLEIPDDEQPEQSLPSSLKDLSGNLLFPAPVEDHFQDDDFEIASETAKTKKKVEFYPQKSVQIYDTMSPPDSVETVRPFRQSRKKVNYKQ